MAPLNGSEMAQPSISHPAPTSMIRVAQSYLFQQQIEQCLADTGSSESRDYPGRLQGVRFIDEIRRAASLPVRTYNTACMYFHKFRLCHSDTQYDPQDAAAAALFTACKIEDTFKKSREILCTVYNLKSNIPDLTPDNPILEDHSKRLVGLERLMLESSGFDFRGKQIQPLLCKIAKQCNISPDHQILKDAYIISLDLYRTFAPLKQTATTLAFGSLELAMRLHNHNLDTLKGNCPDIDSFRNKWSVNRPQVFESLHDLLDYYTAYYADYRTTRLPQYIRSLETYLDLRIQLNKEAAASDLSRYTEYHHTKNGVGSGAALNGSTSTSPVSPADHTPRDNDPQQSPSTTSQSRNRIRESTLRFMLNAQRAKDEAGTIAKFHTDEWEEYEQEVEKPAAPTGPAAGTAGKPQPNGTSNNDLLTTGNSASRGPRTEGRDKDTDHGIERDMRPRDRQRNYSRDRSQDRDHGRDGDRDRDRYPDRDRGRGRDGERDRDRDRGRDQDRPPPRDHRGNDYMARDRDRDRDTSRSRDWDNSRRDERREHQSSHHHHSHPQQTSGESSTLPAASAPPASQASQGGHPQAPQGPLRDRMRDRDRDYRDKRYR